ncbi:hypothetical protein [uncultured Sphingomonas sp.]|uniref:hypothetical protein n=1 Tax=uncultured Sphingomonas sp. TaxID=158754 RepID=UPI002632C505|nr:hypothetical protein [uncultured Sphingomonas sp.]
MADLANDGGVAAGEVPVLRGSKARPIQRVRRARGEFGAKKRASFIEVLAATCNVKLAAQGCGVDPCTPYRLRRADASFAAAWDAALASGYARLEAEALRYALERLPASVDPHGGGGAEAARAAIADSPVNAVVERRASDADLRFVLAILGRHARGVQGERAIRVARPSEAETDARLAALLDRLAGQFRR